MTTPLSQRWYRLISSSRPGVRRRLLLGLLCLLSLVYRLALELYLGLYRLKFIRPARVRPFVIGIGNLTLGGTGKTTLASLLGRYLVQKGARVAILLRGHGGKSTRGPRIVSSPTETLMSPTQAGDEAVLLAQEVIGAAVAVGKDRRKSARLVEREFGADVFLLDDAFQYWRLHKDLEIILWDASQPSAVHRLFPRGILREPLSHLRRADWIWITRADESPHLESHKSAIRSRFPTGPVLMLTQEPVAARPLDSTEALPLQLLQDKRVLAFAGVGNPHAFERTVAGCGVSVCYSVLFPDHYQYQTEDLRGLFQVASELGVDYILTTLKDQVRLAAVLPLDPAISSPVPILALETRIRLLDEEQSLEDVFAQIWQRCLQRLSPPTSDELTPDINAQED